MADFCVEVFIMENVWGLLRLIIGMFYYKISILTMFNYVKCVYDIVVYNGFVRWNSNKRVGNMKYSSSGNVELDFKINSFVSMYLISSFWLIVY